MTKQRTRRWQHKRDKQSKTRRQNRKTKEQSDWKRWVQADRLSKCYIALYSADQLALISFNHFVPWSFCFAVSFCSVCLFCVAIFLLFVLSGQYTELMSKQFYFRWFSLVLVQSLDVKTVLFRAIQLSISTQFKCQNTSILNNSVYIFLRLNC